ncbi:MAG: lanthionine synthetase LanC family protein [Gemmatimonadales bacterium]
MHKLSRRDLLHSALCAGAMAPALPRALLAEWRRAIERGATDRPYLDAALRAEHWLRSVGIDSARGRSWPAVPGDARRNAPEDDLYSGAPGVALFYLDLHAFTGEKRYLDEAVRGALDIAASIPESAGGVREAGLYAGLAGHLFVLQAVHRASGREELLSAARRGAKVLAEAAKGTSDGGVAWNDVTDIISGSAGIGLALLTMRDLMGDQAVDLARKSGDHLLALAKPVTDGQRKWRMDPTFPREMPNFSHGTAGIAYFLATLSAHGGERKHLDAALDGGRYLRAIAAPSGDGFVIRHHDGDGAQLFYLGWCHGPAGTSILWNALTALDARGGWSETAEGAARGLLATGVPEKRTAGFWNNISQCCGNAGVAEYFLERFGRTGRAADLAYARRQADDLLNRSTIEGGGERWVQAENRVSPADTAAQTGWMQGAAGVGAMLLHLDAATRGDRRKRVVVFPDSPSAIA